MMLKGFSIKKILEIAYYLQDNSSFRNHINYLKLIKLIFFADRYHLRHFGSLITFDNYINMKLGPVASNSLDILKKEYIYLNITSNEKNFIDSTINKKDSYSIEISKLPFNSLSLSEIEALNFSIDHFDKFDHFELSNITHDYPEWNRYKLLFNNRVIQKKPVQFSDFFKNPNLAESQYIKKYLDGIDPFREDEEFLAAMSEEFSSYDC